MAHIPTNCIHPAAFTTTPNPDIEEWPQEALTNIVNARDLRMLLNKLKPVEKAAIRQTVPLVYNNLDAARLAGLDTDMARHIHEKYIVKYATKGDNSK